MVHNESLGFRITSFIILSIVAGFILAVIIYFNELKTQGSLSQGQINSMLTIGGILFAIVIILWIWCLIRLFFTKKDRDEYSEKIKKSTQQFYNQPKPNTAVFTTTTTEKAIDPGMMIKPQSSPPPVILPKAPPPVVATTPAPTTYRVLSGDALSGSSIPSVIPAGVSPD